MRLFLTDRTQQIAYSSQLSVGFPQWSVLGPLLCLLCTAELDLVVSRHHADDTHVYVSISARDAEAAVGCLTACLVDIETWLKASRLRLNHAKTQVMLLGSNSAAAGQSRNLRSASRHVLTYQRRHVTVVIDSQLSLLSAGGRRVSQWQLQLRQLWPLVRSMSAEVVKTLVPCRRLFPGTATHCFTASPRVWWAGCSLPRMHLRVWCQALDGTTTSCQCYRSCTQCTGFLFHIGWIWGWPPWSTCRCPAHLAI